MMDSSLSGEDEAPLQQQRREEDKQDVSFGDKIAEDERVIKLQPPPTPSDAQPVSSPAELFGVLDSPLADVHTVNPFSAEVFPYKRPLLPEEHNKQIRRSDRHGPHFRQIKRPKFDDELVESVTMQSGTARLTPRKRPSTDRPTTAGQPADEAEPAIGRKKGTKGGLMPAGNQGTTETTSHASSSNKAAEKSVPQNQPSEETAGAEMQSLASDRRKREKIASKVARAAKQKAGASMTNSSSAAGIVAESIKRWTSEDDVALTAATVHTCDLKVVHSLMRFSKRFTLTEIEERWWMLLYDEDASRAAKKRMDALSRERVRTIQSKIPFSTEEESIIRTVPSTSQQSTQFFEQLLGQNQHGFHHARTAKVVEEHWRELKYYGLLNDQRAMAVDDELLQMEIQLPPGSAILHGSAGGANFPLDVEERHLTRNLISVERETQEWERVLVEAVTGIAPIPRMEPDTVCTLRGRSVTFDIRKDKALIGRSTRRHRVDVNLALEGPSARVSRKQALLKLYDNDELYLHNVGNQPIFVDGRSILKGEKARLNNNAIVEISLIRLHLTRNENYRRSSGQPPGVQPPPVQTTRSHGTPTKPLPPPPQPVSQQSTSYPLMRDVSPTQLMGSGSVGYALTASGGSGISARTTAVASPSTSVVSSRALPPFHHF